MRQRVFFFFTYTTSTKMRDLSYDVRTDGWEVLFVLFSLDENVNTEHIGRMANRKHLAPTSDGDKTMWTI